MADNVGYTPGTGATIAADDIGGALHQRVKISVGADGVATDVSAENPLPVQMTSEVLEALSAQRAALEALAMSIGRSMPDVSGRLRVAIDSITGALTLATITTVGTVNTVSNQSNVGGFAANDQVPALMRLAADTLTRNITVT